MDLAFGEKYVYIVKKCELLCGLAWKFSSETITFDNGMIYRVTYSNNIHPDTKYSCNSADKESAMMAAQQAIYNICEIAIQAAECASKASKKQKLVEDIPPSLELLASEAEKQHNAPPARNTFNYEYYGTRNRKKRSGVKFSQLFLEDSYHEQELIRARARLQASTKCVYIVDGDGSHSCLKSLTNGYIFNFRDFAADYQWKSGPNYEERPVYSIGKHSVESAMISDKSRIIAACASRGIMKIVLVSMRSELLYVRDVLRFWGPVGLQIEHMKGVDKCNCKVPAAT